jgi:hypothetical protein
LCIESVSGKLPALQKPPIGAALQSKPADTLQRYKNFQRFKGKGSEMGAFGCVDFQLKLPHRATP